MFFGGQTYGLTCWLLSAHFCSASKLNWRLYGKVSVRNRSINELYNNLIAIKERILPSFKYSLFLALLLAKTGLDIFPAPGNFFSPIKQYQCPISISTHQFWIVFVSRCHPVFASKQVNAIKLANLQQYIRVCHKKLSHEANLWHSSFLLSSAQSMFCNRIHFLYNSLPWFFICSTFQIFTPSFSTPKLVFIFCHLRPTFPIIASCSGESAQSRFCFGIFLLFTSLQKCKIFYGLGFFYFHLFYFIISSHFHFLMRPEANLWQSAQSIFCFRIFIISPQKSNLLESLGTSQFAGCSLNNFCTLYNNLYFSIRIISANTHHLVGIQKCLWS